MEKFQFVSYTSLNNNNITAEVQVYWDVPVCGEHQELRANRVDPRIVNNRDKQDSLGDELPLGEQP